jgi:hypothetical protein
VSRSKDEPLGSWLDELTASEASGDLELVVTKSVPII